jgi:hypothetical protein
MNRHYITIMEPESCIMYINNKAPISDCVLDDTDTYPHVFCLDPSYELFSPAIIPEKSIERVRWKTVTIKKDDDYIQNKFIVSVIFLQLRTIKELLDAITIETLDTSLTVLTKFLTYYHYCVNSEKYLIIFDILLKRLEILTLSEVSAKACDQTSEQKINRYALNIEQSDWQFSNVRHNRMIPANIPCVYDPSGMIQILQKYDKTTGGCKYCHGIVPENTLVHPCKCVDPVHIDCFKKWFLISEERKNCEICGNPFFKINEKRNKSGGHDVMFFPFDNIYPVPLMNLYNIQKISEENQYAMALCYLQCARVNDLLTNRTNKEDKDIFGKMLEYFLDGSMPSNYLIENNQEAYEEMKNILIKHNII